jgi:hypothetical protein
MAATQTCDLFFAFNTVFSPPRTFLQFIGPIVELDTTGGSEPPGRGSSPRGTAFFVTKIFPVTVPMLPLV